MCLIFFVFGAAAITQAWVPGSRCPSPSAWRKRFACTRKWPRYATAVLQASVFPLYNKSCWFCVQLETQQRRKKIAAYLDKGKWQICVEVKYSE